MPCSQKPSCALNTQGAPASERSESAVRWWKEDHRTELRRPFAGTTHPPSLRHSVTSLLRYFPSVPSCLLSGCHGQRPQGVGRALVERRSTGRGTTFSRRPLGAQVPCSSPPCLCASVPFLPVPRPASEGDCAASGQSYRTALIPDPTLPSAQGHQAAHTQMTGSPRPGSRS